MMLTSKIPQTEPPLETLSFISGELEAPENSAFSGLFSSMVAAQEGVTLEPARQAEVPVTSETALNLVSAPIIEGQAQFSMSDIVNGVVTQLESSSSTQLKNESTINLNINAESDALNLVHEGQNETQLSVELPNMTDDSTLILSPDVGLESLDEVFSIPMMSDDSMVVGVGSPQLSDATASLPDSKSNQSLDSVTLNTNVPMNGLTQGERGVELNVVQERAVIQSASSSQTGSLAFNPQSQVSSSVLNQNTTSWGTQSIEGQTSQGTGQQGQSFGQSNQQSSGQSTQQQAMIFAQGAQENRQRSLEQQMTVRAMDDAITKSEGKELLGGAEIASLDRKGSLPTGLQTINVPLKHPQWGQALGQRIVFMSNNSLQQAQITLNPQSLGQIQVTLQLDKDQKMHISLAAQNGMTRESMENALPKLREMMEQAGVQVASVDVREQKQHFSENESRHENHDKNRTENNLAEGGLTEESPLATVGLTDNIVDYYA